MHKGNDSYEDFDGDELFAFARRDLEAGRLEEALRKLKRVIAGKDADIEALPFAARVYGKLGLLEKARACYRRYLEVKPDAVPEQFELGITHFERGDWQEAKKIWDKVLSAGRRIRRRCSIAGCWRRGRGGCRTRGAIWRCCSSRRRPTICT